MSRRATGQVIRAPRRNADRSALRSQLLPLARSERSLLEVPAAAIYSWRGSLAVRRLGEMNVRLSGS